MKIPTCIENAKPGKYLFNGGLGLAFFIEITESNQVYQLKPKTLQRDGLLESTGWLCDSDTPWLTAVTDEIQ